MTFEEAIEKARATGHDFENDSPFWSNVARVTCKKCGRAVLCCNGNVYGSATTDGCHNYSPAYPTPVRYPR